MMIEGILHLKEALLKCKDEEAIDFNMPTPEQFDLLQFILHLLKFVRSLSEKMSSDKVVTMDRALVGVHKLVKKVKELRKNLYDNDVNFFLQAFEIQLEERFPKEGAEFLPYAYGHLLHPFYKGAVLKSVGLYDHYVDTMIDRHPTTIKYLNKQRDNDLSVEKSEEDILATLSDSEEDDDLEKSILTQIKEKKVKQHHAPIKAEWLNFLDRNTADSKVINYGFINSEGIITNLTKYKRHNYEFKKK